MLPPLPCLAVGAATNSVAGKDSVSMFCIRYRMGLGPPSYTGSRVGQRGVTLEGPSQTACRFGPSLNQPRMACSLVTVLAGVYLFDHVLRF